MTGLHLFKVKKSETNDHVSNVGFDVKKLSGKITQPTDNIGFMDYYHSKVQHNIAMIINEILFAKFNIK